MRCITEPLGLREGCTDGESDKRGAIEDPEEGEQNTTVKTQDGHSSPRVLAKRKKVQRCLFMQSAADSEKSIHAVAEGTPHGAKVVGGSMQANGVHRGGVCIASDIFEDPNGHAEAGGVKVGGHTILDANRLALILADVLFPIRAAETLSRAVHDRLEEGMEKEKGMSEVQNGKADFPKQALVGCQEQCGPTYATERSDAQLMGRSRPDQGLDNLQGIKGPIECLSQIRQKVFNAGKGVMKLGRAGEEIKKKACLDKGLSVGDFDLATTIQMALTNDELVARFAALQAQAEEEDGVVTLPTQAITTRKW